MTISDLKTFPLNQNGYHKNMQTKERIGTLFIYPVDFTPDDCLACNGYSLLPEDYEELYSVIGTKFNKSGDAAGTFRVPDYNITGRFLQPGADAGVQIEAALPDVSFYIPTSLNTTTHGNTSSGYNYHNTQKVSLSSNNSYITGNSIYQNDCNTVQPPSQIVHVCIKYK